SPRCAWRGCTSVRCCRSSATVDGPTRFLRTRPMSGRTRPSCPGAPPQSWPPNYVRYGLENPDDAAIGAGSEGVRTCQEFRAVPAVLSGTGLLGEVGQ